MSYISKCIVYDYEIYKKYDMETLAEVVADIGAKICKLNYRSEVSVDCNEEVSKTCMDFKANFKGLNNIFKFTDELTVSSVDSYFCSTEMC
jgi:hypothetical protein